MRAALALLAISCALPAGARERRGVMAFHYRNAMTPAELEWCGRFDVVVTHDPLPRAQVDALHARGARLVLYEWAVAFYGSLASPWQKELRGVLNARGLRGGSGASDADAFYYDPATREHRVERAREIASKLRAIGYDGVFLDTTTFANVHPEAAAEYTRRHPDVAYDAAFAQFLESLRDEVKLVVTNQGYRDAAHYLPYVDFDVTESLITRNGRLRPWSDARDKWNSIDYVMRTMIAPVMKRYPRVRFVHLNYMPRADASEVGPVIAIARLYGGEAFVALPSIAAPPSDLYFRDPGRPRTPLRRTRDAAWRTFEHQLVMLNASPQPLRIGRITLAGAPAGTVRTLLHDADP